MADKQKFSDEDMTKLKELQDRFNNIVLSLGQISIEIIKAKAETERLENLKIKTEDDFNKLRADEQEMASQLTKTYGAGILDPRTGNFTPNTEIKNE